ncbi:hypothetical protein TRIP_B330420 [uncultured Desulfatiglans sp.]|uniref:Uncharacterized protein n=1 Tax=Uncultured Desulfatiglans sp. TaxID=1748965 RepID=A0A653A8I2_UNCDX|nr:hypothetical protein TRIP_B330420 [uncultured Desulfatiglans sp.]
MVFFANLSVNLHVCLCGELQVASAEALDLLGVGKTGVGRFTRSRRARLVVASVHSFLR